MIIHIVSAGQSLQSIARQYGVGVERLSFDNSLSPESRLPIGQPLVVVLPEKTHTVAPGETLLSIARQYRVPVYRLWRQNLFLNGGEALYPGQTLYIEVGRDPLGSFQIGGYAYPFIPEPLLNRTLPLVGGIMPFTYGFRSDGSLFPLRDERLLQRCTVYGSTPVMHLSTLTDGDRFSTELARTLLQNDSLQQVLLENVLQNLREKGYRGLDVDFEFLGAENAVPYAEFIDRCRRRLNVEGYPVMTALAPKIADDQPGVLYEGHDYALLGAAADALLLMTYEWGYTYGPPMAVSPIGSVERVLNYAVSRIAPGKLFLGLSNYGYDFSLPYIRGVSRATSLSTAAAFALAAETGAEIRYDETVQAPFFEYTDDRKKAHIVWFEDVRSLSARLELLPRFGLRGALYWNLNRENNQNLVLLDQRVIPASFDLFAPEE